MEQEKRKDFFCFWKTAKKQQKILFRNGGKKPLFHSS